MYVCVCNAITDREVREAVSKGAKSLRQLRAALPLGSNCGRCIESVREIVADQAGQSTGRCPPPAGTRRILAFQEG